MTAYPRAIASHSSVVLATTFGPNDYFVASLLAMTNMI